MIPVAQSGRESPKGTEALPAPLADADGNLPPFANGAEAHIFRFTYHREAQTLRDYLLERYRYGRGGDWAQSFFPQRVRLNGLPVHDLTVARPGDEVAYLHLRSEEPPAAPPGPVLYEDEWMLALYKSAEAPVNPSGVYYFTCLAIQAREFFGNAELTPLHRLDLETSGPVLFAKRKRDVGALHRPFHERTLRKHYRALVHGAFPQSLREISGHIVRDERSRIHTRLRLVKRPTPQAGEAQVSLTRVLEVAHLDGGRFSEVVLEPVTGKTNQIRVHLAHVGHPIVGDKKYHPDESVFLDWHTHRDFQRLRHRLLLPRQALHCEALSFPHPFTEKMVRIPAPREGWQPRAMETPAAPDAPEPGRALEQPR